MKTITKEHEFLHRTCKAFYRLTDLDVNYKGEAMPDMVHRMFQVQLVTKRRGSSNDEKRILLERQCGRCAGCGTKVPKAFHVDHNKPLHEGGTNDIANLQILCRECHESKTQLEELARNSPYHPLESFLSPHMYETFHKAPKPMERSGKWRSIPGDYHVVKCLDVAGCRSNAIFEYPVGLPTLSPLDDWEPFHDEEGLPKGNLDDYDFFYVSCPEADLTDPEQADFYFPWSGNRNYCLGAVIYMLQRGVITLDNLVYGVKASRRLPPAVLKAAFENVKNAIKEAFVYEDDLKYLEDPDEEFREWMRKSNEEDMQDALDAVLKRAFLSWWGRCNITESVSWSEVRSMYADDVKGLSLIHI